MLSLKRDWLPMLEIGLSKCISNFREPHRITDDERKQLYRDGGSWNFFSLQGNTGAGKIRSGCCAEGLVTAQLLISAVKKLLPNDYPVKLS